MLCDAAHQGGGDLAGEVNFEFFVWCIHDFRITG